MDDIEEGGHGPFDRARPELLPIQGVSDEQAFAAYALVAGVLASVFTGDWEPLAVVATVILLYRLSEGRGDAN